MPATTGSRKHNDPNGWRRSAARWGLGRWLNQIDKISTSILENYCCDRTHLGRFATKTYSQTFETLKFGCDVSREKGSGWYSGLKPSFLINAGGRETHRLQ